MGDSQTNKDWATERAAEIVAYLHTVAPVEEKVEMVAAALRLAHQEGIVVGIDEVREAVFRHLGKKMERKDE
jgi:hypothetical protein